MQRKLLLLVLCCLISLTACSSISSQQRQVANRVIDAKLLQGSNSGDWPMFGYDPGHTGYVDSLTQPHSLRGRLLWSHKFGPVFSSPVAGLHMLFTASTDGYLYALKQESGTLVWRTYLGNYLTDATPALKGQVLFVSVRSSAIEALNARSGQVYWTFASHEKIQAPPIVLGQRVLFVSRTTLWVLDVASGQLIWKFHRGVEGWPTTGSPALAGNTIYLSLGTGTQFWALNITNGQILWSFDTSDRITSSALVASDTVYVSTWRGSIFALNRANGKKRWSYSLNANLSQTVVDGVGGSMALANGRLYVGDYRGSLLSIDISQGRLIWRFATGAQVLATPVIAAGFVYIGSGDGYFYALDTRTGRPAWRYLTGEIRASASLAHNHLYIGSLNGTIYAFS